jgi:hypothetical protein
MQIMRIDIFFFIYFGIFTICLFCELITLLFYLICYLITAITLYHGNINQIKYMMIIIPILSLLCAINGMISLTFLFILPIPIIIMYIYSRINNKQSLFYADLSIIIFAEITYLYFKWSKSIYFELIYIHSAIGLIYLLHLYSKKMAEIKFIIELNNICSRFNAKSMIIKPSFVNDYKKYFGIQFNHMSYSYYTIEINNDFTHLNLKRIKPNYRTKWIARIAFNMSYFPLLTTYYKLNLSKLNDLIYSDTKYLLTHISSDNLQILINMYLRKYIILRHILQKDICSALFIKCLTDQ